MDKQTFLDQNVDFIDEPCMAALRQVPEDKWQAVLDAAQEMTGAAEPGVDTFAAIAEESIADIMAGREYWAKPGRSVDHTSFTTIFGFRVFSCHQWHNMAIIELDGKSIILTA